MADLVTLLNSLPQPANLACALRALPRPLFINATSSTASAQPALDAADPRIFVLTGGSMTLSFVTAGPHSQEFEVGIPAPNGLIIPGRIAFPLQGPMVEGDSFTTVLNQSGSGTFCADCHAGQQPAGVANGTTYYQLQGLKPDPTRDVPLATLEQLAAACTDGSGRCAIFSSLLEGATYQFTFP